MHRLFNRVIGPILQEIEFHYIVEVGCKDGENTMKLLEICQEKLAKLTVVDPYPTIDEVLIKKQYHGIFTLVKDLSLNILPQLDTFDVILIDGDHNYYTVYHELKILEEKCKNKAFPLIFLHDVSWPYARRDLYYNPDNIPSNAINPYEKKGILYGKKALDEKGLNRHLNNACESDTPKNGVLTAVEDFLKETSQNLTFDCLNCFNGLGIISNNENVLHLFKSLKQSDEIIALLEKERNLISIDLENSIYKEREFIKKMNDLEKNNNKELMNEVKKIQTLHSEEIGKLRETFQEMYNFHDKYNEKINKLHEDYRVKINQLEDAYQKKVIQLERAVSDFEISKEKLLKDIRNLNHQNSVLKHDLNQNKSEVSLYKDSVTYKIGERVVLLMSKPYKIFTFPFDIYKLYKQGRKRYAHKFSKKDKVKVEKDIVKKVKKPSKKNIDELKQLKNDLTLYHKQHLKYNKDSNAVVSIIVLNRNGKHYLETLIPSIIKNTVHKHYELIIVDNQSNDDSVSYIKQYQNKLDLKLIKNHENQSFSKANNLAVQKAKGEYLVFLNNDIEVTYGWLRELLGLYQKSDNPGIVGPKLVYPFSVNQLNFEKELKVQQAGILFKEERDFIRPYNNHNGVEPYEKEVNQVRKYPALTAACILIAKDKFNEVEGFDENYFYGYEDVDIALKLLQKGYDHFYCPTSLVYHYEFGSQEKDTSDEKRERRMNNMRHFKDKWFKYLTESILTDKLSKDNFFVDKPLTFAFAVSNAGENVKEGDYFTALELAHALEKKGYRCKFLARKVDDWYQVGLDTDILITMIDAYDLGKIQNAKDSLIKIAWARNWFDRWCEQICYYDYDMVLASGVTAKHSMKQNGIHDVHLFPIATNEKRFNMDNITSQFEKTDYIFTGSYWNSQREVIDLLDPSHIDYKFRIYGHNWDKIDKFKDYNAGFVNYEEVPALYKSTKIVLDDANFVTKPFGSVNSRVFDALGAGKLVLTNGKLGSEELFNGELPYYTNEEELEELLNYYLGNETAYKEKVKKLQTMVLENHTYDKRAEELIELLYQFIDNDSMNIKIPVPKWEIANEWGDYHFAISLAKNLRKLGTKVKLSILPNWDHDNDVWFNQVLLLRGLSVYKPKKYHFNMMWNISHPDKIPFLEYNSFDLVFVASLKWVSTLKTMVDVPVIPLLQCTDQEKFDKDYQNNKKYELLFVGNSRKIFRKILKDLLPTHHDLSVFGSKWEGIIDDIYIKGEYIHNDVLGDEYASSIILLNDHWDDMRDNGFISNRIFDAFLSSAFIISDNIEGVHEVFNDALITYHSKKDLEEKINYYLTNEDIRKKKIEKGKEIVLKYHTFAIRAKEILSFIKQYNNK